MARTHPAAMMKKMKAIQNVEIAPKTVINKAARAGPKVQPTAKIPSCMPLSLATSVRPTAAASGINVLRAVYPAGSKIAPRAASSKIHVKVRSVSMATIGINATLTAEKMSEATLINRRPSLSIISPTTGDTKIPKTLETAATIPAASGESVRSNTNQGMVIRTMALATPEKKFAVSSKTTGTLETFPS